MPSLLENRRLLGSDLGERLDVGIELASDSESLGVDDLADNAIGIEHEGVAICSAD